jgi:hypothetical protein
VDTVKSALLAVCCILSEIPKLDYMHIKLDGRGHFSAKSFPQVLESFTLLRNVRNVVLDGVKPVYAKYLGSKITGCSPLDHLPKMYDALRYYAGHFPCAAMENNNVDQFKRERQKIITQVTEYMEDAKSPLFDHNAIESQRFGLLADHEKKDEEGD